MSKGDSGPTTLEHHTKAIESLLIEIYLKELYREVHFKHTAPSIYSDVCPQNPRLTSLMYHLLWMRKFMETGSPQGTSTRIDSCQTSFSFIEEPNHNSVLSGSPRTSSALSVETSASAEAPRTSLVLAVTPELLRHETQITSIHAAVDYDIQMVFSYLPYLEETSGPIFEIGIVLVDRPDIRRLIETPHLNLEEDELTLEIVKGPSRAYDEAGIYWVVSLIVV